MPHLILEYTENINPIVFEQLFAKLHSVLSEIVNIEINNCKSRAVSLGTFYIGEGDSSNAFVSLSVSFLEGRSLDLKQKLGERFLDILKRYYSHLETELNVQISVEIKDIQKPLYFKFPELE